MGVETSQLGEPPIKTPFKQPKLQYIDTEDEDTDDEETRQCGIVEDVLVNTGSRLLTLEGQIGRPPMEIPSSTLWQGISTID